MLATPSRDRAAPAGPRCALPGRVPQAIGDLLWELPGEQAVFPIKEPQLKPHPTTVFSGLYYIPHGIERYGNDCTFPVPSHPINVRQSSLLSVSRPRVRQGLMGMSGEGGEAHTHKAGVSSARHHSSRPSPGWKKSTSRPALPVMGPAFLHCIQVDSIEYHFLCPHGLEAKMPVKDWELAEADRTCFT